MTRREIKRESATLKQIQIFAESRAFSREIWNFFEIAITSCDDSRNVSYEFRQLFLDLNVTEIFNFSNVGKAWVESMFLDIIIKR